LPPVGYHDFFCEKVLECVNPSSIAVRWGILKALAVFLTAN